MSTSAERAHVRKMKAIAEAVSMDEVNNKLLLHQAHQIDSLRDEILRYRRLFWPLRVLVEWAYRAEHGKKHLDDAQA